MNRDELLKHLRPISSIKQSLYCRFGIACLDYRATLAAVHDFDSFKKIMSNHCVRIDRMKKLYNLYLSVSKNRSAISIEQIQYLKSITPGYEKTSTSIFLDDIVQLISAGVIIVQTPTIDYLQRQDEVQHTTEMLQENVRRLRSRR